MLAGTLDLRFADRPALAADFTLTRGVAPGAGTVTLAGDHRDLTAGALVFDDGPSRVAFAHLRVARHECELAADGTVAVTACRLEDARAVLIERVVFGAFNLRDEPGADYRPETLDGGQPWSWAALVRRVLAQAGIDAVELPAVAVAPPELRWAGETAAVALAALLAHANADLIVTPAGRWRVLTEDSRADQDAPAAALLALTHWRPAGGARLGAVRIVGGSTLRERRFDGAWVPVCESDGADGSPAGAVVPLADLLAAWGLDDADVRRAVFIPGGCDALPAGAPPAVRRRRAALLARGAYRWYQVPAEFAATLPWRPFRLARDAAGRLLPPLLESTGFRPRRRAVAPDEDPFEIIAVPEEQSGGSTLDLARGIVRFERVMGTLAPLSPPISDVTLEGRALAQPATVALTIAYEAGRLDPATVYTRRFAHPAGAAPEAREWVLPAPALMRWERWTGAAWQRENEDELDAAARALADRHFARAALEEGRTSRYAGAQPLVPDGRVARVRWSADSDRGLVTEAEAGPWPHAASAADRPAPLPVAPPDAPSAPVPLPEPHTATHRGPLVLRVSGTAPPAEARLFAAATALDPDTGAFTLAQLGPWRYPFFLDRSGSGLGGWYESVLVRVESAGPDDYTVREADDTGAPVSGAASFTVRNLSPGELLAGDLALVRETAGGARIMLALPEFLRLVVDHVHPPASGLSARVYAASAAGFDPQHYGRLHDLLIVTDTAGPDTGTLALFASTDGAGARVAGAQAAGGLFDVLSYRAADRAQASGLAVRTDARFLIAPDDPKDGPLPFETATLTLTQQLFGDFSTAGSPPYVEGRLVFDAAAGAWRLLVPSTTIIGSGTAAHRVARDPASGGVTWSTLLSLSASGARLGVNRSSWLRDTATGCAVQWGQAFVLGAGVPALDVAGVAAYYASGAPPRVRLSTLLRPCNRDGRAMVGFNASGLAWASGGTVGVIHTRAASGAEVAFSQKEGRTARGHFSFTTDGRWVPTVPLAREGPVLFSVYDPKNYATTTSGLGQSHATYSAGPFYNASGTLGTTTIHNIGTAADVLAAGSRVTCWYAPYDGLWWCNEPTGPLS